MQCLYYYIALLPLALAGTDFDHEIFQRSLEELSSSATYIIRGRTLGPVDRTDNRVWPLAEVQVECLLKGKLPETIKLRGLGSHALGTFGIEKGIMFIRSCEEGECWLEYQGVPFRYTEEHIKKHLGVKQCSLPDRPPTPTTRHLEDIQSPLSGGLCDCGDRAATGGGEWLASVRDDSGKRCDGTLIGGKWILTAADCVEGKKAGQLKVHLQSDRLSVKAVHVHFKSGVHDVALIELTQTVGCGAFCLVRGKAKPSKRAECAVAVNEEGKMNFIPFSSILRRQCKNKKIKKVVFSLAANTPETDGIRQAHMQSSPLVCRLSPKQNWEQFGIVSTAENCSKPGYTPFTSLTHAKVWKWIERKTKSS
eukprot:m.15981 g.15981  ORF g.15981 m.15981 type:complete len:365 (+) comp26677_c0_seq1:623-1717(+)